MTRRTLQPAPNVLHLLPLFHHAFSSGNFLMEQLTEGSLAAMGSSQYASVSQDNLLHH
jgi:hypothetical protein